MEKLGIEFFVRVTEEVGSIETSIEDTLEAWGIDQEAFVEWITSYAGNARLNDMDEDTRRLSLLGAGFIFGMRAEMEQETRRLLEVDSDPRGV